MKTPVRSTSRDFGVPLKEARFPFPRWPVTLRVPANPMRCMREDDDSPDNTPNEIYWAEVWPAGVALASLFLDGTLKLPARSEPVLELGCGMGLASLAVARLIQEARAAGRSGGPGKMLATDIEPRALALLDENAHKTGLAEVIETRQLDWSAEDYTGQHALILAADALYHPDAGLQLASFLKRALLNDPGAKAVVVDPERWSARHFEYMAREAGFRVERSRHPVPFTHEPYLMEIPSSGPPTDGEVRENEALHVEVYELFPLT